MSEEPFLILHKVRGQPAFDIAICCTEEDGWGTYSDPPPWWIIPTSGHRAYPYRHWHISDLFDGSDMDMPKPEYVMDSIFLPPDWPDHYPPPSSKPPRSLDADADSLLSSLGLAKSKTILRRL